jgi:hypothetical protein
MKIEFEISEEDLLAHQLFATANAISIRKRRGRGRMLLILIYLIAGIFIWNSSGVFIAVLFFLACIPLYFLYRRLESNQYLKHIKAFVKEQMKEREAAVTTLHFEEHQVTMADGSNASTIPLSEISTIYEIRNLYSLKLNNGQAIVLPKNHTNPSHDTDEQLHQLAEKLRIPFIRQLDWQWK